MECVPPLKKDATATGPSLAVLSREMGATGLLAATGAMATKTPRSARGPKATPFVPGFAMNEDPSQKGSFGKKNFLSRGTDEAYTKMGLPKLDLATLEKLCNPSNRYDYSARSVTHDEREAAKESARNSYMPGIPPAWLKHDREVLRFAAYFKEPVHENPKENCRIRQCTVYFFLEDGTAMITEPKVENSGISQGTLLKRHRIPLSTGEFLAFKDLNTAATISVYGRAYRMYDCDEFTRNFYKDAMGIDLEPREEPPLDTFRIQLLQDTELQKQPTSRDITDTKEYHELLAGGSRRNAKLQQYLENDGKVLCFKAFWDDPTRYGTRNFFTVHYHLADDTVEILETVSKNSGRDPYPVFWRKSPLRKNPFVSPTPGMLEPEPDLYKPEDMIVGQHITVYRRQLFLYSCDDFTRDFFREYMGLEQAKVDLPVHEPVHVQLSFPPHTGFGTEEDSMASCLRLTPLAPKKDFNRMIAAGDQAMRFEGKMANAGPEDANRRFVVAISLADDAVGVWEKRQRNSGHAEGKFARKAKCVNPATGNLFEPKDFFIGATVEVNAVPFVLIGADAATVTYMEEKKAEFPVSDPAAVVAKLGSLGARLEKAPAQCEMQAFQELVAGADGDISAHECLTLVRAYGEQEGALPRGYIDMSKLLAAAA